VLFWDCTERRVVIPAEHGAHSVLSGNPEMMRGTSEGVNKYEKGLNCILQIDFNVLLPANCRLCLKLYISIL
jgi:hypothetical protein